MLLGSVYMAKPPVPSGNFLLSLCDSCLSIRVKARASIYWQDLIFFLVVFTAVNCEICCLFQKQKSLSVDSCNLPCEIQQLQKIQKLVIFPSNYRSLSVTRFPTLNSQDSSSSLSHGCCSSRLLSTLWLQ